MAKARKILRHVKAIKNIASVTKTMGMVATARFKKTHNRAVDAKPYSEALAEIVADVLRRSGGREALHPLMRTDSPVKSRLLLVITSHRGLCGAYNNAVVRAALERLAELRREGYEVRVQGSGKRGTQILRFRGVPIEREYKQFDYLPDPAALALVAEEYMTEFLQDRIGGVEVAYMQFVSSGQQRPGVAQILPLAGLAGVTAEAPTAAAPTPYEFLPSMEEIIDRLLPAAVRQRLYQCFLDASVSEQLARMTAMQQATDNAEEMIHSLTVRYNRARQSQITTELAEIMGGAEGVK